MTVRSLDKFNINFAKLDVTSQQAIRKAIDQLLIGYPYPKSLRVKKMEGHENIWEMSPNMDIRITFHYKKPNTVILRNCGHHDKTLRNP